MWDKLNHPVTFRRSDLWITLSRNGQRTPSDTLANCASLYGAVQGPVSSIRRQLITHRGRESKPISHHWSRCSIYPSRCRRLQLQVGISWFGKKLWIGKLADIVLYLANLEKVFFLIDHWYCRPRFQNTIGRRHLSGQHQYWLSRKSSNLSEGQELGNRREIETFNYIQLKISDAIA